MDTIYKLTDKDGRTHGGMTWPLGEWRETDGSGGLCGPGWLHAYDDPLLAILLNPVGADFRQPRLWQAEGSGTRKDDKGLQCGYTRMRVTSELTLPQISLEQKVRSALGGALAVYQEPQFVAWAQAWLSGQDRTGASAAAVAAAARAAEAAAREAAARAAALAAVAATLAADAAPLAAEEAALAVWVAAQAAAAKGVTLDLRATVAWAMTDDPNPPARDLALQ